MIQILVDFTFSSYWFNWRVLLCSLWVFTPMIAACFVLWKYESFDCLYSFQDETYDEERNYWLYNDMTWRPCLNHIHPIWMLAYRLFAFALLLAILIVKVSHTGFLIFYYYTQWTFTSLTIYFGFGSMFSVMGCYWYCKIGDTSVNVDHEGRDIEQGHYTPLNYEGRANTPQMRRSPNKQEGSGSAVLLGYIFQVLYQMNAGAVMLTDCVYWFIIFPFLTINNYNLNVMTVSLHSINAILLLGDAALNGLPFPWYRISYFILWTSAFVIFQWILHACRIIWWPYPFLELSSPYAPLWYLLIASLHIPCYGIFVLLSKVKHDLFSKWLPQSYVRLK